MPGKSGAMLSRYGYLRVGLAAFLAVWAAVFFGAAPIVLEGGPDHNECLANALARMAGSERRVDCSKSSFEQVAYGVASQVPLLFSNPIKSGHKALADNHFYEENYSRLRDRAFFKFREEKDQTDKKRNRRGIDSDYYKDFVQKDNLHLPLNFEIGGNWSDYFYQTSIYWNMCTSKTSKLKKIPMCTYAHPASKLYKNDEDCEFNEKILFCDVVEQEKQFWDNYFAFSVYAGCMKQECEEKMKSSIDAMKATKVNLITDKMLHERYSQTMYFYFKESERKNRLNDLNNKLEEIIELPRFRYSYPYYEIDLSNSQQDTELLDKIASTVNEFRNFVVQETFGSSAPKQATFEIKAIDLSYLNSGETKTYKFAFTLRHVWKGIQQLIQDPSDYDEKIFLHEMTYLVPRHYYDKDLKLIFNQTFYQIQGAQIPFVEEDSDVERRETSLRTILPDFYRYIIDVTQDENGIKHMLLARDLMGVPVRNITKYGGKDTYVGPWSAGETVFGDSTYSCSKIWGGNDIGYMLSELTGTRCSAVLRQRCVYERVQHVVMAVTTAMIVAMVAWVEYRGGSGLMMIGLILLLLVAVIMPIIGAFMNAETAFNTYAQQQNDQNGPFLKFDDDDTILESDDDGTIGGHHGIAASASEEQKTLISRGKTSLQNVRSVNDFFGLDPADDDHCGMQDPHPDIGRLADWVTQFRAFNQFTKFFNLRELWFDKLKRPEEDVVTHKFGMGRLFDYYYSYTGPDLHRGDYLSHARLENFVQHAQEMIGHSAELTWVYWMRITTSGAALLLLVLVLAKYSAADRYFKVVAGPFEI